MKSVGSGENVSGDGVFAVNSETNIEEGIWVFLAGVLGGSSREFFRWKRLMSRKRADLYWKPKYIFVSMVQVTLGGLVGLVFVGIVATGFSHLVAFVSGAGLEELIRQAAKLKVWVPAVAQGNEVQLEAPATLLEFVRQ